MVDPQLLDYVRQQFAAGFSRDDISKALVATGWQATDVSEALETFASLPEAQPPAETVVQPVRSESHIGLWTFIVAILVLIVGGGAFAAYKYDLLPSFMAAPDTLIATSTPLRSATTSTPVSVPTVASTTPVKPAPAPATTTASGTVIGLATTPYVDTAWKYRITPPRGWGSVNISSTGGSNLQAFGESEPNPNHALIHVEAGKANALTRADIDAAVQKFAKTAGSKLLVRTDSTMGSSQTTLAQFTVHDGASENFLFVTSANGVAYIITTEVDADHWASYEPLFKSVIASFAFVP